MDAGGIKEHGLRSVFVEYTGADEVPQSSGGAEDDLRPFSWLSVDHVGGFASDRASDVGVEPSVLEDQSDRRTWARWGRGELGDQPPRQRSWLCRTSWIGPVQLRRAVHDAQRARCGGRVAPRTDVDRGAEPAAGFADRATQPKVLRREEVVVLAVRYRGFDLEMALFPQVVALLRSMERVSRCLGCEATAPERTCVGRSHPHPVRSVLDNQRSKGLRTDQVLRDFADLDGPVTSCRSPSTSTCDTQSAPSAIATAISANTRPGA